MFVGDWPRAGQLHPIFTLVLIYKRESKSYAVFVLDSLIFVFIVC